MLSTTMTLPGERAPAAAVIMPMLLSEPQDLGSISDSNSLLKRNRMPLRALAVSAAGAYMCRRKMRARLHGKGTCLRALDLKAPSTLSQEQSWTGLTPGKEYRLQTMCQEIAENTRTIRSLDWQRDRFDIEFALSNGTTYNAYTIKGDQHTALIDASHRKFEQLFMGALESPEGGNLDVGTLSYIIVSHTEPDHSGLVADVIKLAHARGNTELTVIGSKVCIQFLKNFMHMDFKSQIIKSGEQLDLGGGHVLEFVLAPNLHWPDTIFTYDHKTGLIYTCDAFGMHYCSDEVTDKESVEMLNPHFQLYYNCLMRPNARSVLSALKKMKHLDVKAIATGHGPIMVHNQQEWLDKYREWSEDATKKIGPTAVIFWVSRYGESERLSQSLAYGLTSADVTVEMHDMNAIDAFEITEAVLRNQVVIVFAPPRGEEGGAAQQALSSVVANCSPKNQKFIVCASLGEQDEPVDAMVSRFVQLGVPEAVPALRSMGSTTEKNLVAYEESGRKLGKVLASKKKQDAKAKLNQKTVEALGKMSHGRYIVTTQRAGISAAEVATWVMPAGTEPLTIAVAIAKDASIASFLQVKDTFVLNGLEEGNYLDILKHFQQDFAAGADVFSGIETAEVIVQGEEERSVVIKGGCLYMVCRVISRMDAHDHYIVTAELLQGNLVKDVPVAASHRKTAAYY